MKKIFFIIAFLLTGFCNFIFFPTFVGAYCDTTAPVGQFMKDCGNNTVGVNPATGGSDIAGINDRVAVIVERAISLGAVFAVAFLVWAGIQYTTAYGDDEKIKHAKSTGIYATAGLILLMAAFGLVDIFIGFINRFLAL